MNDWCNFQLILKFFLGSIKINFQETNVTASDKMCQVEDPVFYANIAQTVEWLKKCFGEGWIDLLFTNLSTNKRVANGNLQAFFHTLK